MFPSSLALADILALLGWFAVTALGIILVTVFYQIYRKRTSQTMPSQWSPTTQPTTPSNHGGSPPPISPAGFGQSEQRFITPNLTTAFSLLEQAKVSLSSNDFRNTVENAVKAVADVYTQLLQYFHIEAQNMSISDMAYLLQSRGVRLQLANSSYQLNNLRLKSILGSPVTFPEASWAISFGNWLLQVGKETPV
jgi:hypothetical protein